jgi:hypothetical protein
MENKDLELLKILWFVFICYCIVQFFTGRTF